MRRVKQPVPLAECERRALACLDRSVPRTAASVAYYIWPDAEWTKPQGAGAAASRILKRMIYDGKVRWTVHEKCWGYVRVG